MASDNTGDPLARPAAELPPTTYREEDDRVVLANSNLAAAFSLLAGGTLVSLRHTATELDFVDPAGALAEGFLWRLNLASAVAGRETFTSRDCADFTYSVQGPQSNRDLQLELRWSGLPFDPPLAEGSVVARILLPAGASALHCSLHADLPESLSLHSVEFPSLSALGCADPNLQPALLLPLAGGVLVTQPAAALLRSAGGPSCQLDYPGPASMQFLGYSCGVRATAWLASLDPSGSPKTLVVASMPESRRLALSLTHYPAAAGPHWSLEYPTHLGVVGGDWYDAAGEYRTWAVKQAWCQQGRGVERSRPAITGSHGLWSSHWGGPRSAAGAAREAQRAVNVPIKLAWRCWHKCARGGAYPDYLPPRDGEEAFEQARQQLSQSGVLYEFSLNGLLASPDSDAWKREDAARHAAQDSAGNALSGRHDWLVPMCPHTTYWRQKLASLSGEAACRGAAGIYLEHLTSAAPIPCQGEGHQHHRPAAHDWAAGVRAALAEVRGAVGPGLHIAGDGPAEAYLDLVDAFWSSHPAAEREAAFGSLLPEDCSPIPLFASVYHGYAALIGPDVSLTNECPHDPLWPPESVASLRLPEPLASGNYTAQFCLEVARALTWGHQLALSNFSPEQTRGEQSRRKLAFLAAALRSQAWGIGALLPYAEFMGCLTINCPPVEIDLLINPPAGPPAARRSLRRRILPVLGSAWRMPGAGLALLLVNIHDRPVDFSTRLRATRLPFILPLQLIGRTFSEDGDVPAATLRASGSEVSGRLPGRSVLLVSFR